MHLSKISPYSTHNLLIASAASPIYTWFFVYFASNTGSNFVITQLKFALTHPNFPLTHPNFALTQQNFTPNLSKQESLPSFRVKSSLLILGPFPAFTSKLHCHGMPCHTWKRSRASHLYRSFHALSNKSLVTLSTSKWLLFCVSPFLVLQSSTVIECLFTLGTGKWLLFCMSSLMLFQIATLVENLVTLSTCKWLFSCVCPSMLLQSSKSWNALSNLEQGNGFSPVWILSCYFKVPLWLKTLSHLVHANAFSPVCVLQCFFKALNYGMPCQTWNKEMASLLCEFCHASSKSHFGSKPSHT